MMKRSERAIAGLISLGLVLGLSACGRAPEEAEEFVSRQAFEYHFYPEEYEEEYSSVGRTLPLEGETDYQFRIEAECASGTMETVSYTHLMREAGDAPQGSWPSGLLRSHRRQRFCSLTGCGAGICC